MIYTVDRYQGDPKMKIGENGSYFTFNGGQPIMDAGIENAIYISLFTRKGWAGNIVLRKQSEKVGSDFELACEQPFTKSSLAEIESAGRLALQWMLDEGILAELDVAARVYNGVLTVLFTVKPPFSENPQRLLLTKNGVNWAAQILDPAHRRG